MARVSDKDKAVLDNAQRVFAERQRVHRSGAGCPGACGWRTPRDVDKGRKDESLRRICCSQVSNRPGVSPGAETHRAKPSRLAKRLMRSGADAGVQAGNNAAETVSDDLCGLITRVVFEQGIEISDIVGEPSPRTVVPLRLTESAPVWRDDTPASLQGVDDGIEMTR